MCGRYALSTPPEILAELLRIHAMHYELRPRYNIAPTQAAPVVRIDSDGKRELVAMHWGLIPFWAKDRTIGSKMINARSETAADKPAFRAAFRKRRCIIPASGFYEWKKAGKNKQPYYIHRADGAPLLFAGLWEVWRDDASDSRIESCTVLTTEANESIAALHNRMPAILEPEQCHQWLDSAGEDVELAQAVLRPAPDGVLAFYPVSIRVNSPRNDDPQCAAKADTELLW